MAPDHRAEFSAFYETTWSRTVACAYAVAGELGAAEDIAQEAYTRAWPRWTSITAHEDPAAWVRQVATRLAISRWRRGRVARAFLTRSREPEPDRGPDPDAVVLARALARLPVEQRRAVVLHHLGDLPVREVAPSVTGPGPDVPAPALMTVDHLKRASAGWVTWSGEDGAQGAEAPRCLRQATRPGAATSRRFVSRTTAEGSLERLRFASRDDANAAMLATVQAFDACPQNTGLSNHDVSAELEVVALTFGTGDRRGAVWLISFGDRMDVFHVVGAPPLPEDTFDEVSRLLAADVQVP